MSRPRVLIGNDFARCHGNGQPACADCLRRLQAQLDLEGTDAPWTPWIDATATPDGCAEQLLPETAP